MTDQEVGQLWKAPRTSVGVEEAGLGWAKAEAGLWVGLGPADLTERALVSPPPRHQRWQGLHLG